jgi:sec-independent protein translocase protein TatA
MENNITLIFGNLGVLEIGLIVGAIVLLFGATRIPKLAKAVGESVKEFKKAKEEIQNEKSKK